MCIAQLPERPRMLFRDDEINDGIGQCAGA
jgi:hypothetical protein